MIFLILNGGRLYKVEVLDQPLPHSFGSGLSPGLHVHDFEDVAQFAFDGGTAHIEGVGYVAIAGALGEQPQNLAIFGI